MAQIRQIWRTTTSNEDVTFSICPGKYFGNDVTELKLVVEWGDGTPNTTITNTDPNNTVEITHTYTQPGDHSLHVYGGWIRSNLNQTGFFDWRRVIAYPIESDRTGNETPEKLIKWIANGNNGQIKYSTNLRPWQIDSSGNPLTDPSTGAPYKGVEHVGQAGFMVAGLGTFKNYTNMQNWPLWVRPILSVNTQSPQTTSHLPWRNFAVSSDEKIDMTECFKNCGELIGSNLWTFLLHEPKIINMRGCFQNALKDIITDEKQKITTGLVRQLQEVTLSDGTVKKLWVVTNPGTVSYHDIAGTEASRPVHKLHHWGLRDCTDFESCFENSGARYLALESWNMENAQNINYMFRGCRLERLRIGYNGVYGIQWKLNNVTTAKGTFQDVIFDDLDVFKHPTNPDFGKKKSSLHKKGASWHLQDFKLLNTSRITDMSDMFRDSNLNPNISEWDVDNVVSYKGFKVGGTMIDAHAPAFLIPEADIEILDITGDQDEQYVNVSTQHTDKWYWSVNNSTINTQVSADTVVKLSDMRLGLNTLSLSATDEEGNVDDQEFSYLLAITAVDSQNIMVDDMSIYDDDVNLTVELTDATQWQYEIPGVTTQSVSVTGLSATIQSLPTGMNTVLLSALDSNMDVVGTSKAFVNICDTTTTTTSGTYDNTPVTSFSCPDSPCSYEIEQMYQDEFHSSGSYTGDGFGTHVKLSKDGRTMLVHAPRTGHGRIYVYHRTTRYSDWALEHQFDANDITVPGANVKYHVGYGEDFVMQQFAVSHDGSTVVYADAAQPSHGQLVASAGADEQVKVFTRDSSGSWSQRGNTITDAGVVDSLNVNWEWAGGSFGEKDSKWILTDDNLALNGDGTVLAGGAVFHGNNWQGAVKVWDYNSGTNTWVQRTLITGGANDEELGHVVRLNRDGNILLATTPNGNYYDSTNSVNREGYVKLYVWNGSSWSTRGTITAADFQQDTGMTHAAFIGFCGGVDLSEDGHNIAICSKSTVNTDAVATDVFGCAVVYEYNYWYQIGTDGCSGAYTSQGQSIQAIGKYHGTAESAINGNVHCGRFQSPTSQSILLMTCDTTGSSNVYGTIKRLGSPREEGHTRSVSTCRTLPDNPDYVFTQEMIEIESQTIHEPNIFVNDVHTLVKNKHGNIGVDMTLSDIIVGIPGGSGQIGSIVTRDFQQIETDSPVGGYIFDDSKFFSHMSKNKEHVVVFGPRNGHAYVDANGNTIQPDRSGGFIVKSFSYDSNEWINKGQVVNGSASHHGLGACAMLSDSGDVVVVSSLAGPSNTTAQNSQGQYTGGELYRYEYNTSTNQWQMKGTGFIPASMGEPMSRCLWRISSTGDRVIISSQYANTISIYDWNGTTWIQTGNRLTNSNNTPPDYKDHLGRSINISGDGNTIAVGYMNNNNYGSVAVYRWGTTSNPICSDGGSKGVITYESGSFAWGPGWDPNQATTYDTSQSPAIPTVINLKWLGYNPYTNNPAGTNNTTFVGPATFTKVDSSWNAAALGGRGLYELLVTSTGEELRWNDTLAQYQLYATCKPGFTGSATNDWQFIDTVTATHGNSTDQTQSSGATYNYDDVGFGVPEFWYGYETVKNQNVYLSENGDVLAVGDKQAGPITHTTYYHNDEVPAGGVMVYKFVQASSTYKPRGDLITIFRTDDPDNWNSYGGVCEGLSADGNRVFMSTQGARAYQPGNKFIGNDSSWRTSIDGGLYQIFEWSDSTRSWTEICGKHWWTGGYYSEVYNTCFSHDGETFCISSQNWDPTFDNPNSLRQHAVITIS